MSLYGVTIRPRLALQQYIATIQFILSNLNGTIYCGFHIQLV